MPVVEQVCPPSVEVKISWPSALVLVARKTSSFLPPASHGRSPSWHCGVPRSHVLPPSRDEKRESFTRSMPVLYIRPPASIVRSGSLKPVFSGGSVGHCEPRYRSRYQLTPPSSEVQTLTWLQ